MKQPETDSYDDFNEAIFENDVGILSDDTKVDIKAKYVKPVKNSNMATWRKIEDFWDNYKLNKQIHNDPYLENYSDYLLDGELNWLRFIISLIKSSRSFPGRKATWVSRLSIGATTTR